MEISRSILDECYAHGIEAYPEEACGLITESGELHRTRNVMDEFHARDRERYQRTSRNGYMIDPIVIFRLDEENQKLRIAYHSHPDKAAYFSETDQEEALWEGMPKHPGLDYLVCGIKDGKPNGAVLAVFNIETGKFDIEQIE
jgi:proteasome lid subunit RPN8/RPN11